MTLTLVLRRGNLQIHGKRGSGGTNYRVTQEDLINDWFTSLFDKRMAEARIGFRDQKRAGQSPSGKNPGRVDGFITAGKNTRLAIFEAFRLFSTDVNVITEHLNKIVDYDHESLSPVFIVAYCGAIKFQELVENYARLIVKQGYKGFDTAGSEHRFEPEHASSNLWLGVERRMRGNQEVIFYHLLLNMRSN